MENYTERINLPLSPDMYEAIKVRSRKDGVSAVAYIRQCIDRDLRTQPKLDNLTDRVEALERALHAAKHDTPAYANKGRPHQKTKGHGSQ